VTIRLIAQNGILGGKHELYMQGEAAMGKVTLATPLPGREFHLFCSPFNAGAKELAEELRDASIYTTTGKNPSVPLTYTTDISKLAQCDHMVVLLDQRTWTSGDDTAKFVEHIHEAMRIGVHLNCIHEFPAVVGPRRFECEFGLMFNDDWTPPHLTGGKTNLYKEIAFALKGVEWRKPGQVAVASKLVASAAEHNPITVTVPDTYQPKSGPNKWTQKMQAKVQIQEMLNTFDSDRNFIVSPAELQALLSKSDPDVTLKNAIQMHEDMLEKGFDTNGNGKISVEELALYWIENKNAELNLPEATPSKSLNA